MAEDTEKKMTLSVEMRKMLKESVEEVKETEYLATGDIGLDLALTDGKGIPVGSSILLWASPGCGKSTLLGDMSKRILDAQKEYKNTNFKILYLDVEGSVELMKSIGLGEYMHSHDFIYVNRGLCWRHVEGYFEAVLGGKMEAYKDVKVIVIDSLNNILSDANMGKSVADGDFGSKAKERTLFLSKYLPKCKEKGISVFFIAQERHNQDAGTAYGAPKKKAAATDGDKHNVDIVLKCSKKDSKTDGARAKTMSIFGENTKAERWIMKMTSIPSDCKNRFIGDAESEVLLVQGVGVDNSYVIRKLLEANNFLKAEGGWFTFNKELASNYKLPEGKLRRADVMSVISERRGDLVTFIKEAGCYSLTPSGAKPEILEGSGLDDYEEEEE